jgi:hypothetical protein
MRRNKMATYIRNEISNYAKSITVEIDFNKFSNGQSHAFFETLKGVASIAKLTADNYLSQRIETDIVNADVQQKSGDMRMGSYDEHAVKQIKESMIIKNELPNEVNTFIEKLQNKTLGVVPVDFYEVANRY